MVIAKSIDHYKHYTTECQEVINRNHNLVFDLFFSISKLMFKKHITCNANLCNIFLVSGLSTPIEMKLKLIPIFRHMHYDLQLTAKVGHSTCKGIVNI